VQLSWDLESTTQVRPDTHQRLIDRLGPDRVFPTINAAVQDHERRTAR
jgi:hypothetical protein